MTRDRIDKILMGYAWTMAAISAVAFVMAMYVGAYNDVRHPQATQRSVSAAHGDCK